MTLPTNLDLPLDDDLLKTGDPSDLQTYLRTLTETLEESYIEVAENINGSLKLWTPVVYGFTSAGSGTYSRQTGWSLRQGLIVDLWIDVEWSAHTGTGPLIINLPYKAAVTENTPWVGELFSSMTLTAGYTNVFLSANSNSISGVLLQSGSGVPVTNVGVTASGRLLGHIRYIGQQYEN